MAMSLSLSVKDAHLIAGREAGPFWSKALKDC